MMSICVDSCCIYTARLSPALNGSSEIRRFEHSEPIEIRIGIISDFYTGLPHVHEENMLQYMYMKRHKVCDVIYMYITSYMYLEKSC